MLLLPRKLKKLTTLFDWFLTSELVVIDKKVEVNFPGSQKCLNLTDLKLTWLIKLDVNTLRSLIAMPTPLWTTCRRGRLFQVFRHCFNGNKLEKSGMYIQPSFYVKFGGDKMSKLCMAYLGDRIELYPGIWALGNHHFLVHWWENADGTIRCWKKYQTLSQN